jgi:hypothetical protein
MDKGYSNLLTEILPAIEIEANETADLQIVCPECREPIYKAVRHGRIHYLAHYEAGRSAVSECELRVNGIGGESVALSRSEARTQNLRYFLAVLPEMLDEVLARGGIVPEPKMIAAVKRHKEVGILREDIRRSMIRDDAFLNVLPGICRELYHPNNLDPAARTGMAPKPRRLKSARQLTIAQDVARTLLGEASRPNYAHLFATCWAYVVAWIDHDIQENAGRGVVSWALDKAYDVLTVTPFTSRNKANDLFCDLQEMRMEVPSGTRSAMFAMNIAIGGFMADMLLSMDYLGWLQRRVDKR